MCVHKVLEVVFAIFAREMFDIIFYGLYELVRRLCGVQTLPRIVLSVGC